MNNISFDEYLNIDAVNYSLLKSVADSGPFYNKTEVDINIKRGLTIGTLVDDIVLPTGESTEYIIMDEEIPTATTLVLANKVIKECIERNITYEKLLKLDEKKDFIYSIAVRDNLWKSNLEETRRNQYENNDSFYNYIKYQLIKQVQKKLIVSPSMKEKADYLSDILINHNYTRDIISQGENQLTFIFKLNYETYKIRLDKLHIDHKNKIIKPFDIKTGEAYSHNFLFNFYNMRYYLQGSLYSIGVHEFAHRNYPDYKVDDFKFIYISTKEKNPVPTIWSFNEEWAELGWKGFSKNGIHYKGVEELTDDLNFYKSNPDVTTYREVIKNEGNLIIELPY